jgi:branched-chain amino acid aminotransferase
MRGMASDALAILDGTVLPAAEATIGVTDLGLIRGDGVFEVIMISEGRMFALEDHLRRMATSAQNLRLEIDLNAVRADIDALVAEAGPVTGAVRVMVTRSGRRIGIVEPARAPDPPLLLATVEYVPTRILDGIKSLSYGANMLATRLAVERGGTEALLVTPHGRVLEGPTWSFFWVRDGILLTPPLEDRILASITRQVVIEETGATEAICTLDDLRAAEEAFIASTVREVMPIAAIDDVDLPGAPGEVTMAAREQVARRIERELGAPA